MDLAKGNFKLFNCGLGFWKIIHKLFISEILSEELHNYMKWTDVINVPWFFVASQAC